MCDDAIDDISLSLKIIAALLAENAGWEHPGDVLEHYFSGEEEE